MVIGAVSFIRACLKLNIPGYLENPLSSMVWKVPKIQALARDARVHLCDLDMCQFKTPWRKPTRMLTWLCEFPFPRCAGQGGQCSRTHRPRVQLSGV
eukprot:8388860-Lingulodinium_polyedra.AAC.1